MLGFQTIRFWPGNDLPYIALPADVHGDRLVPQAARARAADATCRQDARRGRGVRAGRVRDALLKGAALPAASARGSPRRSRATPACRAEYRRARQPAHRDQPLHEGAAARSSGARSGASTAASWASTATPPARTLEHDPAYARSRGPYTGGVQRLRARRAEFESDLPYEILDRPRSGRGTSATTPRTGT